ncbi:M23 family metallopeptidase [Actinoplanes hulinensis]|uniref:M23 family metallopeptidase n=1 Tax=Actinoplanes hulinensis TaxID=1144547 RepID=A0ABS7AXS9_9ACTN|nr:M23 family metallopeptidase [Actinoplanes hulinensis]MBW6433547.1 M23 family metallopeptidase [Actinoplanes hulinensis]
MRNLTWLAGLTAAAVGLSGCGVPGSNPAEPAAEAAPAAAVAPVEVELAAAAATYKYVFPVRAKNASYHKTHSGYPATDIFAACGKPFVATTGGVVLEVSRVDKYKKGVPDGPYNGGKFVSILGDDGVRYYGSHLSKVTAGIKKGVRVKAGQSLGKVGKTGNSSGVCHVHYGISPACKKTGDWKVRRGVVWPASYLTSWRKGGRKSPVKAVATWNRKNNCKA